MGKNKYIETPDKLWELFTQYRGWTINNPLKVEDYVGKDADRVLREKAIPLTFQGFECWLFENDVISHLSDYEANKEGNYSDYSTIITRIKKTCYVNKFNGAAAGIFQQNIIARELGLVDKKEIEQKTITVVTPED